MIKDRVHYTKRLNNLKAKKTTNKEPNIIKEEVA
nr:MAG TPA: hypothetical protein [Inoviridae sp.]